MLGNIKRLVYLTGIYSVGSVFEKALAFFLIPICTTYLGTYDYGIVGLMSITVGLISKFTATPVIRGLVRYYYAPEYKNKGGLLLFNSFLLLSIQSLFLAILFYFLRNMISIVVFDSGDLVYIVEVYAFILFFHPLSDLLLTFLRLEEKAKFFVFVSWLTFLISAVVILFGLIYLKLGILALIYGNLAAIMLTVACILPVFWKSSTTRVEFSILGLSLRFGYPLIAQGFSNLLIQSGDRYVLRIFTSLSTVGLYSFGYGFAAVIHFLLVVPLKYALQPVVLRQEEEPEKLKEFLRSNCAYFYFVGMFFCLFLSLFSKEAMEIMARKKDFWESWIVVPIIMFCYLQHGLGIFFNWGLVMAKKANRISANVLVTAVINIGLNFIFIPYWGILGAAFATLISYLTWNALNMYYSAKFYNLHFELERLGHITIIGVGLYLLSLLIASGSDIYLNIGVKTLIVIAYPILILTTGFFNRAEKQYLKKFFFDIRANGILLTLRRLRVETEEPEQGIREII